MHEFAQDREARYANYASQLRKLTRQITDAIAALEHNNLEEFLVCLSNQEAISAEVEAELKSLISFDGVRGGSAKALSAAEKDLLSTARQLAHANRVFSAFLKRSQRSTNLLAALYQSCAGSYGSSLGQLPERRTISCEV